MAGPPRRESLSAACSIRMTRPLKPGLGRRGAVVLAALLALLAGFIYLSRSAESDEAATSSILGSIPREAMLVVVVDVASLRTSEVGRQLLGLGRTVARLGLDDIANSCGSDPMDAVTELAIVIPNAPQDAGFGIFARGDFKASALIGCAEKIWTKRGGRPVRVPEGRFTVIKDASLELTSAEIAATDGGPLIFAEPSYVRAALGTVPEESLAVNEQHQALRKLVPGGQLVATAVLTAEQRRGLIEELRTLNQTDSPFRSLNSAALSLTIDTALKLSMAIRCDAATDCKGMGEHIRRFVRDEASRPAAKAIGLSSVLENMTVAPSGDVVQLRLSIPATQAEDILNRALALQQLMATPTPANPSNTLAPKAPPRDAGDKDAGVDDAGVGDAGVRIPAKP